MDNKIKKWGFIVNPVAGNGYAKSVVPALRESIRRHGINGEIFFTEKPGHAAELSEKLLLEKYDYIIAVGGDGTVNEVSAPLINDSSVAVGVIPAGTGNDFIQVLGFPDRFVDSEWDILFRADTRIMDTGSCNGRTFLNGMGLGFDAEVAAENYTEPGKVKRGGKHKYIWHIIKTLLFFNERNMSVTDGDNHSETDCFINTIAVGRRFAGGFFLTPGAIADDGLLDVCMIRKLGLLQRFRLLLKVPSGEHINDKRVNYYKTDKIEINFGEEVPFHVDGELGYAATFDVRINPGSLRIIYNPDGNHYFRK
jgi:YegS/Rv2252/BmrU family lipid kinase